MVKLLSRLNLSQTLAVICGGFCLAVSLTLVLVSILSSRYILEQQEVSYGNMMALESTGYAAKFICCRFKPPPVPGIGCQA